MSYTDICASCGGHGSEHAHDCTVAELVRLRDKVEALESERDRLRDKLAAAERDAARWRNMVEAHNESCDSACKAIGRHGHCEPYTTRNRKCPDCPRDWAIEIDAATQPGSGGSEGL